MLIRDKTGGPLLQAELISVGGSIILEADNGQRTLEIDQSSAKQFYKLISATKNEVAQLKKAGFHMDLCEEFEARDG